MSKKVIDIIDRGDGCYEVTIPYECEQSNDFDRVLRDRLKVLTQRRLATKKPRYSKIELNIP